MEMAYVDNCQREVVNTRCCWTFGSGRNFPKGCVGANINPVCNGKPSTSQTRTSLHKTNHE